MTDKKEPSDRMSKLASRAMKGAKLTPSEIKSLGATVLSLDVTPGPRTKKAPVKKKR